MVERGRFDIVVNGTKVAEFGEGTPNMSFGEVGTWTLWGEGRRWARSPALCVDPSHTCAHHHAHARTRIHGGCECFYP